MDSKSYKSFFLVSKPEKTALQELLTTNEDEFLVATMPLIFNSKRCLRDRKTEETEIMTLESPKQAS